MAKRLLLVVGQSGSGKSSSLKGLDNHERTLYLCCEAGKGVPFKNKFMKRNVTEPLAELIGDGSWLTQADKSGKIDTIVLDSLTFLMRMFETKYIRTATNTQAAWGLYGDFLFSLFQNEVPKLNSTMIVTAHTSDVYNSSEQVMRTGVNLKGSVMKTGGPEAFFNEVVACKKMPLRGLEKYQNEMLHITPRDEEMGYKHVIQTRLTGDTCQDSIKTPEDMWDINETYIDGNIQLVLNRINEYYGD